jgi:hypothetical protein
MEVLYERVAGVDVGKASVKVCVDTPSARRARHSQTRTFKTTTGSRGMLREWVAEASRRLLVGRSVGPPRRSAFAYVDGQVVGSLRLRTYVVRTPGTLAHHGAVAQQVHRRTTSEPCQRW